MSTDPGAALRKLQKDLKNHQDLHNYCADTLVDEQKNLRYNYWQFQTKCCVRSTSIFLLKMLEAVPEDQKTKLIPKISNQIQFAVNISQEINKKKANAATKAIKIIKCDDSRKKQLIDFFSKLEPTKITIRDIYKIIPSLFQYLWCQESANSFYQFFIRAKSKEKIIAALYYLPEYRDFIDSMIKYNKISNTEQVRKIWHLKVQYCPSIIPQCLEIVQNPIEIFKSIFLQFSSIFQKNAEILYKELIENYHKSKLVSLRSTKHINYFLRPLSQDFESVSQEGYITKLSEDQLCFIFDDFDIEYLSSLGFHVNELPYEIYVDFDSYFEEFELMPSVDHVIEQLQADLPPASFLLRSILIELPLFTPYMNIFLAPGKDHLPIFEVFKKLVPLVPPNRRNFVMANILDLQAQQPLLESAEQVAEFAAHYTLPFTKLERLCEISQQIRQLNTYDLNQSQSNSISFLETTKRTLDKVCTILFNCSKPPPTLQHSVLKDRLSIISIMKDLRHHFFSWLESNGMDKLVALYNEFCISDYLSKELTYKAFLNENAAEIPKATYISPEVADSAEDQHSQKIWKMIQGALGHKMDKLVAISNQIFDDNSLPSERYRAYNLLWSKISNAIRKKDGMPGMDQMTPATQYVLFNMNLEDGLARATYIVRMLPWMTQDSAAIQNQFLSFATVVMCFRSKEATMFANKEQFRFQFETDEE